jgi:toxin ParE1/3/4
MASPFQVEWTDSAYTDLADIIRYVAKDSPINATKVYQRIRARTRTLRTLPNRGHAVPELVALEILSYRELSIPPYRIIYRIEKRKVFVLAVLDGRRDPKQILAERLLRAR